MNIDFKMLTSGKEPYFLEYNKDNIAEDLIQSERHLRRLKQKGDSKITSGHANCVVKHMLDTSGESNEAISHSLIVEGPEQSENFRKFESNVHKFRKNLQKGNLTRDDAIEEVRKLRNEFESFNPEYNVSKCRSCGDVDDLLESLKREKNLNTNPHNSSLDDEKMVNAEKIAVMYGGNFLGKLIDTQLVTPNVVDADQRAMVNAGMAIGLPLISRYAKIKNQGLDNTLVVLGAYEMTKLVDYAAGMLGLRARVRTAATRVATQVATGNMKALTQPPRIPGVAAQSAVMSKYIVT